MLGAETPGVTGCGKINKVVPQQVRVLVEKAKEDLITGRVKPYPWP